MSETKEMIEAEATEAIRQVIAESGAVDFVDVVNAVHKRFRINVTSAQVEQVYHDLATETKPTPKARTSVTLTAMESGGENLESNQPESTTSTLTTPARNPGSPQDDLSEALQFVKSVGGLANAKRLFNELESTILGS